MSDKGVTIEDLDEIDSVIMDTEKPKEKKGSGSRKRSGGSSSALSKRLAKMIRLVGNVVEPMDSYDAEVLRDNAGEIADALADLANESPRVRRILEGSLEGGAWTAVGLLVGGKIALPIAVHHGVLPEPMNGNLAQTMEIPVRTRKPRRRPVQRTVAEAPVEDDEPAPLRGTVRHPDTGEFVEVDLDPETGRPYVDGDGRPIIPNDDDSE